MNLEPAARAAVGVILRSDLLKSRPLTPDTVPTPLAEHWYALHTRSRYEKVVDRLLLEKGLETFLPLTARRSPMSLKRFREAQIPLFPGYTFARLPASCEKFREVRRTTGVVAIVGSRSGPICIADTEIESIQTILAKKVSCSLASKFSVGQRVAVRCGPLEGVQGELVRRKNRRLFVVRVRLIQRLLEVDLSPTELEALSPITASESSSGS